MITVSFDNMEEIRRVYDPILVERATRTAISKLTTTASKEVSLAVRDKYQIKAGRIKQSLKRRITARSQVEARGFLIYTSPRLSLANFASRTGSGAPGRSARPKIKTARGMRLGARVRVLRNRPSKVVKGAFWAPGTGGVWQIWKRETEARRPIRKLAGPSVSHMIRSAEALSAVEKTLQARSTIEIAAAIKFHSGRRAGVL